MDFFTRTGKMALGSRLRRLSDLITNDAAKIYQLYENDLQPRWFPVFYVLCEKENQTITEIASQIDHTHVSVVQIIKAMSKKGYVIEKSDRKDGRKTLISLSKAGKQLADRMQDQYRDVGDTIEQAMSETDHDLWKAMEEWEHLLSQKSLLRRVQEQKKIRESKLVEIVDYKPQYKKAFRDLNEEWISTYFKMEKADYKALDHPKEYIINKGGFIFIALYKGDPVGACALIKMDDGTYELAKMAVSPKAQGKGIGWLLGQAVINKARHLKANKLYLESNTILTPAITLYYKLGFQKVTGRPSPYERSNIQMELIL
jgi:DNA-binding MarR family transcriptional regulator/N-acetylglutamate synthase-like GNAT family acetyltransferase